MRGTAPDAASFPANLPGHSTSRPHARRSSAAGTSADPLHDGADVVGYLLLPRGVEGAQLAGSGAHARWGCMVANAHAGQEAADPAVRDVPARHHRVLRDALRAALAAAARDGQPAPQCPPEPTADMLALLAYGVNLRSRAGADAAELTATVTAALDRIAAGPAG